MTHANDDALLADLRAAFGALDPVPEEVLAAGRDALTWRTTGLKLAALVADTHTDAGLLTGVRGADSAVRLLTFSGVDVTVEIEVSGQGAERCLVGRLAPPAPAVIQVRSMGGDRTGRADPAGHFVLSGVPSGLTSLVFRLPDATSIVTSWVHV